MAKIVIIGAGSHTFSRNLITDVVSYPELQDATISLMDIDEESSEVNRPLSTKIRLGMNSIGDLMKIADELGKPVVQPVDRPLLPISICIMSLTATPASSTRSSKISQNRKQSHFVESAIPPTSFHLFIRHFFRFTFEKTDYFFRR